MVRTIDEIMSLVKERVGDSTEDADIAFIEDIKDTLDSIGSEGNERIEELKEENEELRKKYRDRFFSLKPKEPDEHLEEEETEKKTFEDLFKEEK